MRLVTFYACLVHNVHGEEQMHISQLCSDYNPLMQSGNYMYHLISH
jgi:hypothetical protein